MSSRPYRLRTSIRGYLPWFLINLGFATKGEDCEKAGGEHEWYNKDDKHSACYHCQAISLGQLWKESQDEQPTSLR